MTSTPDPAARLTVRDPADLLAAVPYVLGFHPRDSLVVVAVRERRVTFAVRADLPAPAAAPVELAAAARGIATTVAGQGATGATVIGYGEPERLAPVVAPVRTELERRGVPVLEALRATAGRFWSYLCEDPACCPAGGTAYDLAASPVTAAATYAGQVALPDRAALAALVAPVGGLT
ncbi:MAG TPA: DUF4192 domain-containing protein, partial [Pilimelia sp.]|nr:DUF4192 domain-containing protein [Pilimelia sp.]